MKKTHVITQCLLILTATLLLVSGCGQKGDLYRPDNSNSDQQKENN